MPRLKKDRQTAKYQQSTPLGTNGVSPAQAQQALVTLTAQELDQVHAELEAGNWQDTVIQRAQRVVTLGLAQLERSIPILRPEALSPAINSAFNLAQTLADRPSTLTGTVSLKLAGDLSREQMLEMLAPSPKRRKDNPHKATKPLDVEHTPIDNTSERSERQG